MDTDELSEGPLRDRLQAVARVYGPATWELYDQLDQSLEPRGPDMLHDVAAEYLTEASKLLDVGCRDAEHLIRLVRATGAGGIGLDPVPLLVQQAQDAVARAGLGERIAIVRGVMQALPLPDADQDFIWCRDVLEVVDPLEPALRECARVLKPGGHMLVYTVFATDQLTDDDARLLSQSLANVPQNLDEATVEAAFAAAGLTCVRKELIGTEWREYLEERTGPASQALLRLARLRRRRAETLERFGADIYAHVEANLHWEVFQFLGKLQPALYVLQKR